ncbi:unnamed protein product [Rhizoctonia solani]|uniref:N,O-diacetylmuramidase n=1 Tax=Rhizoctonia solani TaxID=456999 RepID=A0A8H3AQY2_9AGAM|nr:unnamed protein product [Rhizoctonia solani]
MKLGTSFFSFIVGGAALATAYETVEEFARLSGIDVSGHQKNVDWGAQKKAGVKFAYVKATEGTSYRSPYFTQQYDGSYRIGMIRGAYHFARPDRASGAAQANYFLQYGGKWTADGKTLPGMLDIENNDVSGGDTCYGISPVKMVSWIKDFSDTYHSKTGRYPAIYTNTPWWKKCTGNSAMFGKNPLVIANWGRTPEPLPAGWTQWTIWQYTDKPIDHDYFNGDDAALARFAKGTSNALVINQ